MPPAIMPVLNPTSTALTCGLRKMKSQPSRRSRKPWLQSMRRPESRLRCAAVICGARGSVAISVAATKNVAESTTRAISTCPTSVQPKAAPSLAMPANASPPTKKVPYAATMPSELAAVRCLAGTMLGTMASLAGLHSDVASSSASDASTSAHTRSMNGMVSSTLARTMSHTTRSRLRLKRSTMMPPADARKNPGRIRAVMTSVMAAPG